MKALEARTWNEALSLVGLPTLPSSGVRGRSREKEWKELRRIATRLGRAPTMPEYDTMRRPGLMSAQGLAKPLGRWSEVLRALASTRLSSSCAQSPTVHDDPVANETGLR
ncbi:MAG: homing endonuclease associated repeat-containing protein [Acidimicrobiales bacterium]